VYSRELDRTRIAGAADPRDQAKQLQTHAGKRLALEQPSEDPMRRSFLLGLVPALAFASVFLSNVPAEAGPKLDLDLDLGTTIQNQTDFSLGGGLRFGYRFNVPYSNVYVQPELGLHYMNFGTNSTVVAGQFDYAGAFNGGLRLGIRGPVQPAIFGHVGVGVLGYELKDGTTTGQLGPEADIGAGLDFRVAPGFTLGAQVAFNHISLVNEAGYVTTDANWFNFGLTAGFEFWDAPVRRVVYYR
jgi:hypothetical protein